MQKKITILALHLYQGGIERYISLLSKMFEKDFNIEIISTYRYSEKPEYEFNNDIKIRYLTEDYPDRISNKKLLKEHKYLSIIKEIIRRKRLDKIALKKNIEAIKSIDCDYVITTRIYHNKLVNKYLKNSKIIKIATEHNYHNNNKKYINEFIKSVSNFDYVVHCTNELFNFYKDKINTNNVLIPNPIYIENNNKSKINNKNIISVGRLSYEKGYEDLIDVMHLVVKKDRNIKLTICGDGYLRDKIEEKIRNYNLENNVTLKGFVKGEYLENEYINASLYVLPSHTEAFGLVLLEAMHFALPIIAFDSASGARELLSDGIGILIRNRDKEKMASEIVKILNDKTELKLYQNRSLEKVSHYAIDKIYKLWEERIFKNEN